MPGQEIGLHADHPPPAVRRGDRHVVAVGVLHPQHVRPAQARLGAHGQLGDLPRLRPRRPPAAQPRLHLAHGRRLVRRDRTRDVEPPVEVARRQHQRRRGEAVAAEVGGLPDVRLAGRGHGPGERAAVDGAAAVAPAVRADEQHRVRHRLARQRCAVLRERDRRQLGGVDDAEHGRPRCRRSGVGEEDPRGAVRRPAAGPADQHRPPSRRTGAREEDPYGIIAMPGDLVRPGAPVLDADPARGYRSGPGKRLLQGAGQRRAPRGGSIRFHPCRLAEASLTRPGDPALSELRVREAGHG